MHRRECSGSLIGKIYAGISNRKIEISKHVERFVSVKKNMFPSRNAESYTVPRAAIRIQRKAKKEKKNTLAFTLPRFHAFSVLREKSKSNSVGMNSLSEAASSQRIKSRLDQYTQLRYPFFIFALVSNYSIYLSAKKPIHAIATSLCVYGAARK